MTMAQAIERVINIALGEVGYLEKRTNSQLDNKTANAGSANYTKYWRDIKASYQGQPWCACFVTWVFVQAFGVEKATRLLKHYPYVYCPTMASLFTLKSKPTKGDIVVFYRNGTFAHTGLVISTNSDGSYFTTVEGNTSGGSTIIANGGGVCKKSYYTKNLSGTKFITVDWSIVADVTAASTTATIVNEIKVEPFDAYGIVTASILNVRSIPSTDSEKLGEFIKNDSVHILGHVNGWFKVKTYNGTGYVSGEYVTNIKTVNPTSIDEVVDILNLYGIVTDTDGMKSEMNTAPNGRLYWTGYKLVAALHKLGGKTKAKNITEYTDVTNIVDGLAERGVIDNSVANKNDAIAEINKNLNGRLYWIARTGLTYLRERD